MSFTAKSGALSSYKHDGPLNFPLYATRNFGLTAIGETAVRYFGLVQSSPFGPEKGDFLSATALLRKLDYFKIIPGAQAAALTNEVVNGSTQTAASACEDGSCTSDSDNTAPAVDPKAAEVISETAPENDNIAPAVDPKAAKVVSETAPAVVPNAVQTTPEAASEGVFAKLTGSFESIKDRVSKLGISSTVTGYVSDNKEWLAVAGSVVAVYSTFNWLTANKIQNGTLRNLASMATGVGVTCLGAYALGQQLDFNLVADLGVRIMGYHGLAQAFQKPAYWTLGQGAKVVSVLGKPMAFPAQVAKAK